MSSEIHRYTREMYGQYQFLIVVVPSSFLQLSSGERDEAMSRIKSAASKANIAGDLVVVWKSKHAVGYHTARHLLTLASSLNLSACIEQATATFRSDSD